MKTKLSFYRVNYIRNGNEYQFTAYVPSFEKAVGEAYLCGKDNDGAPFDDFEIISIKKVKRAY